MKSSAFFGFLTLALGLVLCSVGGAEATYSASISGSPLQIRVGDTVTINWSGYSAYTHVWAHLICPHGAQELVCLTRSANSYTFMVENFTTVLPDLGCKLEVWGASQTQYSYECSKDTGALAQTSNFVLRNHL